VAVSLLKMRFYKPKQRSAPWRSVTVKFHPSSGILRCGARGQDWKVGRHILAG